MTEHKVLSRDEWTDAREELLVREKEHTRLGDELARQRGELPWVAIEKEYRFDADNGTRTLAELFDGRSQLLIYHFMFGPSYEAGCPTCSSMVDGLEGLLSRGAGARAHATRGRAAADRASECDRDRDRRPRIHLGSRWNERLHTPGRRRLPDLCGRGARSRVPDGLLPDPRPDAEGARRGRWVPDLDPPP